jgi:flavin reductase (DIM6/NTAB) family NADH-FMN oxidoreductase RutF
MPSSSRFVNAMAASVSGMTIVSTTVGGRQVGQTVSAMFAVSAEPPLLAVSIPTASPLPAALADRGAFAVDVLADHQVALAEAFAGRGARPHEFLARDWWPCAGGLPRLHGAAARFECRVERTLEAGTHTLVLGAVTRAVRGTATPLAYTRRGYVAPLAAERLDLRAA